MIHAMTRLPSAAFAALLFFAFAGAAEAGSLRILNCTAQAIQVATYNSNDKVQVIAHKDACLKTRRQRHALLRDRGVRGEVLAGLPRRRGRKE